MNEENNALEIAKRALAVTPQIDGGRNLITVCDAQVLSRELLRKTELISRLQRELALLAKAIKFDGGQEVLYGGNFVYNIEAMKQFSDNPNSKYRYTITFGGIGWSIRDSMNQVLSKSTGEFDYESLPSSRPDGWLEDTRFATVTEAFAFLEEYKRKKLEMAEEVGMLLWHPDKDKRIPYKRSVLFGHECRCACTPCKNNEHGACNFKCDDANWREEK